jgi:hypothetical protein
MAYGCNDGINGTIPGALVVQNVKISNALHNVHMQATLPCGNNRLRDWPHGSATIKQIPALLNYSMLNSTLGEASKKLNFSYHASQPSRLPTLNNTKLNGSIFSKAAYHLTR